MNQHSKGNSKTKAVILIMVIVLAGSAGAWYWLMYKPEQEAKEKARLEQIAKEAAEQKRKEQAARKKVRYDKLLEEADTEFKQSNWEAALSLYTEASSLFPDQKYPQDQLILVNVKLDEKAALEANIAAGIVESVLSPVGRYFVIVSSSVDGDLAKDYAIKLAREGNNVKILEPNANAMNNLFHRVSVGDYSTWDEAVNASTVYSSNGSEVWVLKY
ncbi:MAG: hypothetical protein RIM99_09835 [Cyclobacteriaceae bacterium]